MSKLVCNNCKSVAVEYEDYCGGTSYYRCKTCGQWGDKDKFAPQTVFHSITQSPEVLAKFLVFHNRIYKGRTKYHSAVVGGEFDSYEEAIAATLAKLKEVAE